MTFKVVARKAKNQYTWKGLEEIPKALEQLKVSVDVMLVFICLFVCFYPPFIEFILDLSRDIFYSAFTGRRFERKFQCHYLLLYD